MNALQLATVLKSHSTIHASTVTLHALSVLFPQLTVQRATVRPAMPFSSTIRVGPTPLVLSITLQAQLLNAESVQFHVSSATKLTASLVPPHTTSIAILHNAFRPVPILLLPILLPTIAKPVAQSA